MKENILEIYQECLIIYLKQEAWMKKYPKHITEEIKLDFKETLGSLGELGYILETEYGYRMTLEEKLKPKKLKNMILEVNKID